MENQDYIVLSKEQIAALVKNNYIDQDRVDNATECRLYLKEDTFLWTNALEIVYPNGSVSYFVNFHKEGGLSLDNILSLKSAEPAVYFYFNGKFKYSKPMNQLTASVQRICKDLENSGYKMLTANFNRYVYCNYQTRDTQIVEFKLFTGYVDQNGKKLFSEDRVCVEGRECTLMQHYDDPGYYVRYTLEPMRGVAYGRTVEIELTSQSDFSKITKVKDVLGLDD